MANLEIRGTVTEISSCTVYVDGDPLPGYDVTIHQAGYEEFCSQQGFPYYPPRVRFTSQRLSEFMPAAGDKVIALVQAQARRGSGDNKDKTYVNLKGRVLTLSK